MRRSVFLLTPLIPLALAACEDGPAQTFSPATGTLFNNGDVPAAVSDAGDSLNNGVGGGNKTQLCSGDELQKQWGSMISQPIAPARYMAGLDVDDGDKFPLLAVEKAETGPMAPIEMWCTGPNGSTVAGCTGKALKDCALDYVDNCVWGVHTLPYLPPSHQPTPSEPPTRLCQPTVIGPGGNGGDVGGSLLVQWGNNGEYQIEWAIPTHKTFVMNLNPGYTGHMTWTARLPVLVGGIGGKTIACKSNADCTGAGQICELTTADENINLCVQAHWYDWQIGQTIKKDGTNQYQIDWNNSKLYPAQVDELYRGIAKQFAPDIYDHPPPGTTCVSTGTCLARADAADGTGRGLFGMRPVSFYMFFDPPTLPAPSGFTVQSAYLFNIKYAPYSGTNSYFRMYDPNGDAGGAQPYTDGFIGTKGTHCSFGMGDTFDNLKKNCIDVFYTASGAVDTAADTTAENKVLGNLAHDDQNFSFSIVGINQNFRPVALDICPNPKGQVGNPVAAPAGSNCGTRTQDIIHDDDSPVKDPTNTLANNFQSDVRSFGAIQNDAYISPTTPKPPYLWKKDWHGSGAVAREYARLVQTDLAKQYVLAHKLPLSAAKVLHDPSCFFPMSCQGGAPTCSTYTTPSTCGADPSKTCGWNILPPPFDPTAFRPAPGCTGFESFVSAAEPIALGQLPNYPLVGDDLWDQPNFARLSAGAGGNFKPGGPLVVFCNDPGIFNFCALSGDQIGTYGDLLGASTTRVLQYLGGGDVLNLPLEARDRRYFFKQWTIANAKYFTSPAVLDLGHHAAGGSQVRDFSTQPLDTDNLIFDSFGGGASRSEFIDFDFADNFHDPVSVEQRILVLGSNLQATNFFRKLDREERALFNSLATDRTQASWGPIRTNGVVQVDQWQTSPQTACPATAQCTTAGFPNATCDLTAGDINNGFCVNSYPRRNAGVFLTNLSGSPTLLSGAVNTLGQAWWNAQTACAGQPSAAVCGSFPNCKWDATQPAGSECGDTCSPVTTQTACTAVYGCNWTGSACALNAANNLVPVPQPATGPTWVDPCNPVSVPPAACKVDADCPGIMACSSGACVAAKTAYYCATNVDASCLGTQNPVTQLNTWPPPSDPVTGNLLTRENGKPLLEGYCSVWQRGPFALQPSAITPDNPNGVIAGLQIVKTFPDEGEALVQMPSFINPYKIDAKAAKAPPLSVMVPWLPLQEGIGYPVMTTGTRDVFVNTEQLDFAGQVVTPVMDVLPCKLDPKTGRCDGNLHPTPPYFLQLEAIETQDFLGDVFLCVDPVTSANRAPGSPGLNVPGDILSAHMYTSAETIVDYLATHPGAQDACQIIVRYSPYNNYPDFIQANVTGVRLGIEQGAGFGRVTDATVYAAGTGTVAPP